jgi:starvation-inducible DNA-binding protein
MKTDIEIDPGQREQIAGGLSRDLVTERIRALGLPAPGTCKRFGELSAIKEEEGVPKAQDISRRAISSRSACKSTRRPRGC